MNYSANELPARCNCTVMESYSESYSFSGSRKNLTHGKHRAMVTYGIGILHFGSCKIDLTIMITEEYPGCWGLTQTVFICCACV